jgi:hypothetical protein
MAGRLGIVLLVAATFTAAAVAAPGDPEKRDIRPGDQARARKANLRLADLPSGFRSLARPHEKSGPAVCGRFRPDLSDLTITGEAGSPNFVGANGTSIFSEAEVYRTVHDEQQSWQRTTRREALPCFAQQLERQSASTPIRIDVRSYAQLPAPRFGDRSAKFRFVAVVVSQGVRIQMWIDVLGVARGRADAALYYFTVGHRPAAAQERALLAKLSQRLAA